MRCLPCFVLLVALCLPGAAVAESVAGERSYLVVYEDSVTRTTAQTDALESSVEFETRHEFRRALKGFSAPLSPEQVAELRADPTVAEVTPVRPVSARAVDVVAGDLLPPGVRRVGGTSAGEARDASSVAVAVLDTGVDLEHPDLNVTAGTNCMPSGGAPDDVDGHGTHVAGTIGARNNGSGVVGVAPGTKIYAVKVLGDDGSGTTETVLCGIEWVLANRASLGIKVANLSLGGGGVEGSTCANSAEHDAYCRMAQAGISVVVAAGNDGWDYGASPPDAPASYPEVLTVTAMADTDGLGGGSGTAPTCRPGEADDRFASFSNYFTTADHAAHTIAAPGVCILSAAPGGGTATMSGTSMAAPHVAGAVALCLAEGANAGQCDGKTPAEIITLMKETATASFTTDLLNPDRLFGPLVAVPANLGYPATTINDAPALVSTTSTASFAFSASEEATFECRLDGAAWGACTSPVEHTGLADGAHTFSVRATDLAGNTDATPATHAWTVDLPAPAAAVPTAPAAPAPVEAPPAPAPAPLPAPVTAYVPPTLESAVPAVVPTPPVMIEPWFTVGPVSVFARAADQTPAGIRGRHARLGSLSTRAWTRVDARLVLGRGKAARALGRLRTTLGRGETAALRITISDAGMRRLAGRTSVTARLIITATAPSGPKITRRTVTLAVR